MQMRMRYFVIIFCWVVAVSQIAPAWAEVVDQKSVVEQQDASIEKLRRIRAQVEDGSGKELEAKARTPSREQDSEQSLLSRGIQGLMLCLGIFFVIVYFLKKNQGAGGGLQRRRVRVIEQQTLAPKASVALLTVDGRELLLGVSEGGITLLQELKGETEEFATLPEHESEEMEQVYKCINQ